MNPETVFSIANIISLTGWIVLIFLSPFWPKWDKFLIGTTIALLALIYTVLILSNFQLGDVKKFGSLEGILSLFQNKTLLTAGWVHYLAFDLMAAFWIKRNSVKHGINHWVIVPSLIFTFMLGPLGFLSYLLIRWLKTKEYFADNSC